MVVCDRCGKKIIKPINIYQHSIPIYSSQGAYIGHPVDLCEQCNRSLEDYLRKAKSYFMVNKENPEVIFDNVKYWDSKW